MHEIKAANTHNRHDTFMFMIFLLHEKECRSAERRRHYAVALATARLAITPIRWARYSALPWMSLLRPSGGTVSPSSDFGEKRFFNASSKCVTRNTPSPPAPVTATRISDERL